MTRKRSKIRSKTRSDSSQKSEDEILYCICRSSDGTRFMIACDNCEEWYHGDCINVTPKQANNIKRFFCHLCIGRNPSLEIEYKTIKENRPRLPNLRQQIKKINFSSEDENDADLSSSSTPEKPPLQLPLAMPLLPKRTIRKRSRPSISDSCKSATIKKRRGRPKEKPDEYDDEATEDEIETSGFVPTQLNDCPAMIGGEEQAEHLFGKKQSFRNQITNNNNSYNRNNNSYDSVNNNKTISTCGNCDGCKMTSNCGKCEPCKKHGNINSTRQLTTCVKRICCTVTREQKQYSKHYSSLLEDFDGVMGGDTGFSRHDNIRSSGEYDIGEIRQRLTNQSNPNKELTTVGSKMRRGDHLPGGGNSTSIRRGLNTTTYFGGESLEVTNGTSYRYRQQPANRLSRNQNTPQNLRRSSRPQSDVAQMSSNTSSVSGQLSPHQYQYGEESEEDVMIPGELISPTNGQRRTVVESDHRTYASFNQQQQQQRIGKNVVNNDTRKYQYGLSYPDHLYCKHHRFYNWHSSVSGDSISPDMTNCKPDTNLKSDKDGEILSHSRLRSPSLDQKLPPGNFMVLDRNVKQNQISSTGMRHKSQLKNTSSISNDRHDVSETFVNLYSESSQAYPIIDLNQQIASGGGLPLNSSSQIAIESNPHSTAVFSKQLSTANVHRQEFYTINDEDDLEINWPKETVNV